MDHWMRNKWIEKVLSKFDRNAVTPISDDQEPLACQVLNIKVLDKVVGSIGGVAEVHDCELYIKALFSVDAIRRFEEREESTSCAEFVELRNSLLDLTRYHIMVDVQQQIEKSDIAICVEDFAMTVYKALPGTWRTPLQPAIHHPTVAHDLRRMWRAKYAPDEPDTCQSQDQSQDSPDKCTLSVLLEAMENTSQQASELSEAEQDQPIEGPTGTLKSPEESEETCASRVAFELGSAGCDESGQGTVEALEKAVKEVETKLIVAKNFPELAERIPEYLRDAQGFSVEDLPQDEELDLSRSELLECWISEEALEKLCGIEEWKPDYIPPSSLPVVSSSSSEVISFLTEPSADNQAEKMPKDRLEDPSQDGVTQCGSKRKLSSWQIGESPHKAAKNSVSGQGGVVCAGDVDCEAGADLGESSEMVLDIDDPDREVVTEPSDKQTDAEAASKEGRADRRISCNCESSPEEEGLTALCQCLTPLEEALGETENQVNQQDESLVSNTDSTDTSLVVSCEMPSQSVNSDPDKDQEDLVIFHKLLNVSSEAESLLGVNDMPVTVDSSMSPAQTGRNETLQCSGERPVTTSCTSDTNSKDAAEHVEPSNTIDEPEAAGQMADTSAEVLLVDAEILNVEHVSNSSGQRDVDTSPLPAALKQRANSTPSKTVSEQVTDDPAKPQQVPDKCKEASNTGPSCLPSTTRTVQTNWSVNVIPLKKTVSSTASQKATSESRDERPGHRPITQLRSPVILPSISTPVHSLTSHQPRRTQQSETASSLNTNEGLTGTRRCTSRDGEVDPACTRQLSEQVEDYVLEWCASYFQRLNRKH
ncbi:uncharacterized protein LOC110986113 [Acanthaster planci]|uniref:Uncharacterized protein LOC110986113 n=1 Tax=Acanthaster planci TaxID=133434 RepID=A0A8B7ZCP1_ACAPL|nr:uncharacterized protein LOC110986113 [Acanthaster planci]